MRPQEHGDFFDYSTAEGFASNYVRQYYGERSVNNDEVATIRFLIPRLAEFSRSVGSAARYLEIGCGPTLHHAIMVAPYVQHMVLSDFLEGNRTAVEQWRTRHSEAFSWQQYTRFILATEHSGVSEEEILNREDHTREKIRDVVRCDLMSSTVVETTAPFDLVGCFYCLEEVARTAAAFRLMIRNVATLIRPGGTLMISALRSTSFYHVQSETGEEIVFPCLDVSEELLQEALSEAGFEVRSGDLTGINVEDQAEEGVPGVILAFVTKPR